MPRTLTTPSDTHRLRADAAWQRLLTWTLYRNRYSVSAVSLILRASDATRYLPREVAIDLFTRADGGLGANWSGAYGGGFGSLTIFSNAVRASATGGTDNIERYTPATLRDDQWVEVDIQTIAGTGGRVGGALRFTAPPTVTGYVLGVTPTASTIYKYVAGVQSTLGTATSAWANGETAWFEAEGHRLRVKKGTVTLLEVADTSSPILSGGAGLSIFVPGAAAISGYEVAGWHAGNLREEYLPLVAEWGEIGDSLEALNPASSPATFDPLLSNVVPIATGGLTFASVLALFREGTNTTAYDEVDGDVVYAWLPPGGVVGRDVITGARDDVRLYLGRVEQVE